MNNDQIREIREIAIDFRGDGCEEGAYAVDVLDQAGALLDRIELDQNKEPMIGKPMGMKLR